MTAMTITRTAVLIKTDRQRVPLKQLSEFAAWLSPHLPSAAFGGSWQWSYTDWGVIFYLGVEEHAALAEVRAAVADCPFPINGVEVLT